MAFASGRRAHRASLRSRGRDTEANRSKRIFEATSFAATARATLSPVNLRRQFALVPQDLIIFSGSIAENIRFVRPEASLEQVRRSRPKRR